MKITVKRNELTAEVVIDMSSCTYPYAIREALVLALELDGYTKEMLGK
jgi:hypothetical protein